MYMDDTSNGTVVSGDASTDVRSIGSHAMATANKAAKGKLPGDRGEHRRQLRGRLLRQNNTHGNLNVVSLGILLPLGGIVARYLNTFKSADLHGFTSTILQDLIAEGYNQSLPPRGQLYILKQKLHPEFIMASRGGIEQASNAMERSFRKHKGELFSDGFGCKCSSTVEINK